jgi:ABC-2 type transport system permease protein
VKLARDTWLIFQRHFLLVIRARTWILFALAQPVTYVLLFAPLLKIALRAQGVTTYTQAYQIYVPGLLTVMAIVGGAYTGFGLLRELRSGIIERARVTPVSRLAMMLGRALREVVMLLVQAVVVTLLALPFGLRVPIGDLLLAYLLLAMLSMFAVNLSYAITMRTRNEASLGPMMNSVSQPIMLISGVLLPLTLAPLWMRRVADWNPFYWATNGMRALFAGHIGASSVWLSMIIVIVLTTAAVTWSLRLFARSVQ